MTTYRCLIVDDNEIERDAIEMYLRKINRIEIAAVCSDGAEAAQVLLSTPIDLVFSDIDMPEVSGLGLLKSIKNPPAFIFITSYAQYAIEGFDHDALDFIVKPATFERLLKATTKAIDYLDLKLQANDVKSLDLPKSEESDCFYVKESKGFAKINFTDVIFIESMADFSKIYTLKEKIITLINLKNLEKQLPQNFMRIHKQYIINLNHIITVQSSEVVMEQKHTVTLSNSFKQGLMDKIADKTLSRYSK